MSGHDGEERALALNPQRKGCAGTERVRGIFAHYRKASGQSTGSAELDELDMFATPGFFYQFPVEVMATDYSAGVDVPDSGSNSQDAKDWVKKLVKKCQICEKASPHLSAVHILRSRAACADMGLHYGDESNYLVLCGNEGENTCHDAFDNGWVTFLKKNGEWMIVGGESHGQIRDLVQQPRRRALHTHLAWCVSRKTLACVIRGAVSKWLQEVDDALQRGEIPVPLSPPPSPKRK